MKTIYFLILGVLFASCSSALKIRVDVLDREALRRLPSFQKLEAEQLYEQLKAVWTDSALGANRLYLKVESNRRIAAGAKNGEIAPSDTVAIRDSVSTKIDNTFNFVRQSLGDFEKLNAANKSDQYQRAKIAMNQAVSKYLVLKEAIEEEIGKPVPALDPFFKEKRRQLLLSDDDLLDDVLTSSVVHSPYKFWRQVKVEKDFSEVKYRGRQQKQRSAYSRTVVRTLLGNSDIAITMENKGHFTVKGVRLDAAKVAEATFKGLTQSIHFLAMTTGAPVKKGDAEVPILPELEQLTTLKATQEATDNSFRISALSLASVVLRQEKDLTATGEKKKAAIKVLKEEVKAFKDQFASNPKPE